MHVNLVILIRDCDSRTFSRHGCFGENPAISPKLVAELREAQHDPHPELLRCTFDRTVKTLRSNQKLRGITTYKYKARIYT